MRYVIATRKKESMRYPTAGDYYTVSGTIFIDVCKQKKEEYDLLIAFHELIEEFLTRKRGIRETDIMAYDKMFEEERDRGIHDEFAEPGEDERAQYFKEHAFAAKLERQLCEDLGLDWETYNKELESA